MLDLCYAKKPHEKIGIRGELTFFAKVSKMAVFGKVAKGGPRENLQKWPIFLVKIRKAKKILSTSRLMA